MLRRVLLLAGAIGAVGTLGIVAKPAVELRQRISQARDLARSTRPYEQLGNHDAVLVVGDSTALGTGADRPSESLAGRIGARLPEVRIVNRASNGACFADVVEQLRSAPKIPYRFVLVVAGANDVLKWTPPSLLRMHAEEVFNSARHLSGQVVVMALRNVGHAPLLPWPFSNWLSAWARRLAAEISEVAQQQKIPLVNLFYERPDDPFALYPQRYIARDLMHPSSEGYALWFQRLQKQVPRLLG